MGTEDVERGEMRAQISTLTSEVRGLRDEMREVRDFVARVRGMGVMILSGVGLAGTVVGAIVASVTNALMRKAVGP